MKKVVDKLSPITGGQLELCEETAEVTYRGEVIIYQRSFYHCVDSGLEFTDEELDKLNLKLIYDTYRRMFSIPLAEDLKAMRVRYGIPAVAISQILGLGENQFGLYEDGTVPTVSVGRLLALAMNPENMIQMLMACRNVFNEKLFQKYYRSIEASFHPSVYEVELLNLSDCDTVVITSGVPVTKQITKAVSHRKKESYKSYAYASVC